MRFCDKLPKLRKENNLSQEQLADRLGVSRQAVSKWESGSSYPDMDKMIQICNILNCTLEDLLDDGVIKQNSKSMETGNKNNFNTYFQDFLKFITKSYNMFCSMTFKEKVTCFVEMIFLCFVLFIIGAIISSILDGIIYSILKFLPETIHYFLSNIIETVYMTILLVLGIIIVIHIFKIRYLDYFITVEDSNVKEKTIEEPIEKQENKKYVEKAKEKIIIRDPKHSTFSFMNLLGKLIMLFIKFFAILFFSPLIFLSDFKYREKLPFFKKHTFGSSLSGMIIVWMFCYFMAQVCIMNMSDTWVQSRDVYTKQIQLEREENIKKNKAKESVTETVTVVETTISAQSDN